MQPLRDYRKPFCLDRVRRRRAIPTARGLRDGDPPRCRDHDGGGGGRRFARGEARSRRDPDRARDFRLMGRGVETHLGQGEGRLGGAIDHAPRAGRHRWPVERPCRNPVRNQGHEGRRKPGLYRSRQGHAETIRFLHRLTRFRRLPYPMKPAWLQDGPARGPEPPPAAPASRPPTGISDRLRMRSQPALCLARAWTVALSVRPEARVTVLGAVSGSRSGKPIR